MSFKRDKTPKEKKGKKIKIRKLNYKRKIDDPNSEQAKEYIKKDKNRKIRRWKIFKIILFTCIGLAVIGTGVVIGVLTGIIDKTESIDLEELRNMNQTTFIYDKDGNQIGSLNSGENRSSVDYNEMPKYLTDAVVSIEDERFWKHNGVDVKRTVAAVFTYVINGGNSTFGGSTITQQLVKNVTGDKEKDWTRKIREWYRAISLENTLEKEEIMESYLNTIYLGAGASGVEIASYTYFNKSVKDINLAEAATLAAIIQMPETYNPYKGEENAEKLGARKELVLKQMKKLKKISQKEYDEAMAYEIKYEKGKVATGSTQSYFVDAVVEEVVSALQEEYNIKRAVALQMVYSNGYKIYSTMDPKVQSAIDEAYKNDAWFYPNSDGSFMQSAMVIIENDTGNIVGLSGGAGEKTADLTLNRATQIIKQPGSSFKPIMDYGPAFEAGISYPGMGVDDSQITIGGWTPKNFYGYYNGYVSVRDAIMTSMNIPAIRTLQAVGVDEGYKFAKSLGISTLVEEDKNLSAALGGLHKGVTVKDMAGAYSAFVNGGLYIQPKLYTKVLDRNDKTIFEEKTKPKRVMKETTAYLITSCLETVVTLGTGTSCNIGGGIATAGKTGNTNDDYDQWFVGYSPYYTAAVWNGYDENRSIGVRKTGSYPYTSLKVWGSVMKTIHSGLAAKAFDKPSGIITASVCTASGKIATDACKSAEKNMVKTEIFASGTVPTETCNVHKKVPICNASGKVANDYCPKDQVTEKGFITREYTPNVKPSDWGLMVPTEGCNIHNSATKEKEDKEKEQVEIYNNQNKKKN